MKIKYVTEIHINDSSRTNTHFSQLIEIEIWCSILKI